MKSSEWTESQDYGLIYPMSETFEDYPISRREPIEDEFRGELETLQIHAVSEYTDTLLRESFTTSLSNNTRLQTKKVYGLPKNEESTCPKLDPMLRRRLSNTELSRLQALTLDAVGPLAFLLEESQKDGVDVISAAELAGAMKTAITLLGNAVSQTSYLRRRKILKELNPDLEDLTEKNSIFKGAAPLLFGEGFESNTQMG